MIDYHNGSIRALITDTYPEYPWLPWKFEQAPKAFWNDINNIKNYVYWLSNQLNIKKMEDWYKVTHKVKN